MDLKIGDVIQYHNRKNEEGLHWKVFIIYDLLSTVLVTEKGIRIKKVNVRLI